MLFTQRTGSGIEATRFRIIPLFGKMEQVGLGGTFPIWALPGTPSTRDSIGAAGGEIGLYLDEVTHVR
jgi:hypothetical protein